MKLTKENRFGVDVLGGANYKKQALDNHEAGRAIGILVKASGWPSGMSLVRAFANAGTAPIIRTHYLWEDSHRFTSSHIFEVIKLYKKQKDIIINNPNILFFVSPYLEQRSPLNVIEDTYKAVLEIGLPKNARYVNSYINGGAILDDNKVVHEVHNTMAPHKNGRYIWSADGMDLLDADIEMFKERHKDAVLWMNWCPANNMRYELNDPTKRQDRKLIPPAQLLQAQYRQLGKKDMKLKTGLPKGWLFKAFAEAERVNNVQGSLSTRSFKPVMLCPAKGSLSLRRGKIKHDFYASGSHNGRNVYRLNKWGIEMKGIWEVWNDDKMIGRVNPVFRQNEYRA
jgi:hypothetical protein